jgi:hypothetical protein
MSLKFKKIVKITSFLEKKALIELRNAKEDSAHDEVSLAHIKNSQNTVFGEDIFLQKILHHASKSSFLAEKEVVKKQEIYDENRKKYKQFSHLHKKNQIKKSLKEKKEENQQTDVWSVFVWGKK